MRLIGAAKKSIGDDMQTFMPFPSLVLSANVLDRLRCFKQVIESRQILAGLGVSIKKIDGTFYKPSHKNHPVYKLWRGFEDTLKCYHDHCLMRSCLCYQYKTDIPPFCNYFERGKIKYPAWFGRDDFHSRHRAALLAKNPEWYSQWGWTEDPKIDYVWE